MSRSIFVQVFIAASLCAVVAGCGSSRKEGGQAVTTTNVANAAKLGDANCLQCHNAGKDLTMINDQDTRTIGAVWQDSLHNVDENGIATVHCEDCHGGGEFHWGLGPLASPVPMVAECNKCHNKTRFLTAPHANTNMVPDSVFSQIPTPVSQGQHIEECSVCHDSNQRFVYDSAGNLLRPDPKNLPNPAVACASCHDAHQVGKIGHFAANAAFANHTTANYQIFRKVQVNAKGANDAKAGTWIRPALFVDPSTPSPGKSLNHEALCGSCHSKGTYKNSGGATHNDDIYGQWQNSAHAAKDEAPWAEFADGGGENVKYPVDLTNPVLRDITKGAPNQCLKCHNGIATDIFMGGNQGTTNAGDSAIIWGDSRATCLTCHNVHSGGTDGLAVKNPAVMTNYSASYLTIKGKFFLDGQSLPSATTLGNSVVCIFCHQGRESGLSLYKNKLAPGRTITGSFFNPHYLGTAAMLWGANGYEYASKSYSFNAAHQGANCTACHMANPTPDDLAGGHTWERNVATCNTASCHGGFGPIPAVAGSVTPDLSTYRATFDANNYSGDPNGATQGIADAIRSLQQKLIALLAAQPTPIFYNDLKYPYFFFDAANTINFGTGTPVNNVWTPATYKAAFNLSFVVKGLPSSTTSQANVPNGSAAAHDYKYCIQLLQDSIENLSGAPVPGAFRPVGTRPATVYGPGQ